MLIVDGGNEENVLLNVEFSGKKIVELQIFFTIVDVDLSLLNLQTDLFYYGFYSFNGMGKEEGVRNKIKSDIFAY